MSATCLDLDAGKLAVMEAIYPRNWRFVNEDAFDYLARCGRTFDVLTADAPTALSDRCLSELPSLLAGTKRVCIISVHAEMERWDDVADGLVASLLPHPWRQTGLVYRTTNYGGCYWLVLERMPS